MELDKIFENIMNEAETTKYMACCFDPEDYYEETSYIDEDGELSYNSSGAKLFNTEDEAIDYADENKPIDWISFAMPFSTTLNESDDTYKAKRLKEAKLTVGDFCDNNGIENPEAFRDFLRKLWDIDHVEMWSKSSYEGLERALDKYEKLNNKKYRTKFSDPFRGADLTIGEFCDIKGIENPEAFRDFLRRLWDFNHIEMWTISGYDGLEKALEKYKALDESDGTYK